MRKVYAALLFLSVFLGIHIALNAGEGFDPDYDRLDGNGPSGKRVNVIEWEGNLEIHVYPSGSLKGLALKIDDRNKSKRVMVIGYRFDNAPKKQLIRRAVLGIDLKPGFSAFKDPGAADYDKIVISNNGLSNQMVAYRLDPQPKQLYPDGHPALMTANADTDGERTPANAPAKNNPSGKPSKKEKETAEKDEDSESSVDEDGTVQPFFIKRNKPLRTRD